MFALSTKGSRCCTRSLLSKTQSNSAFITKRSFFNTLPVHQGLHREFTVCLQIENKPSSDVEVQSKAKEPENYLDMFNVISTKDSKEKLFVTGFSIKLYY